MEYRTPTPGHIGGKCASNDGPRCKAYLAHAHVESHEKRLFPWLEDGGNGCYRTVGHSGRPNTRDNTADDEQGGRMSCSAYGRPKFEDDEENKKGPLYVERVRIYFSCDHDG
jgi:hypothetical protein